MKTVVNNVLVLPDNPYLTQPIAVRIKADNGDLMRHRLRKLLKDNQVVFIDTRLANELANDLNFEIEEKFLPWVKELVALKCHDDLELLKEMRRVLDNELSKQECDAVYCAKVYFICREIWLGLVNMVLQLEVVKRLNMACDQYKSLFKKYERLEQDYNLLMNRCDSFKGEYKKGFVLNAIMNEQ